MSDEYLDIHHSSLIIHHSKRAGGGIRTHIDRITGAAPFYVEPHRHYHQQGRKDSNPVRLVWNQFALPGARPC